MQEEQSLFALAAMYYILASVYLSLKWEEDQNALYFSEKHLVSSQSCLALCAHVLYSQTEALMIIMGPIAHDTMLDHRLLCGWKCGFALFHKHSDLSCLRAFCLWQGTNPGWFGGVIQDSVYQTTDHHNHCPLYWGWT